MLNWGNCLIVKCFNQHFECSPAALATECVGFFLFVFFGLVFKICFFDDLNRGIVLFINFLYVVQCCGFSVRFAL